MDVSRTASGKVNVPRAPEVVAMKGPEVKSDIPKFDIDIFLCRGDRPGANLSYLSKQHESRVLEQLRTSRSNELSCDAFDRVRVIELPLLPIP